MSAAEIGVLAGLVAGVLAVRWLLLIVTRSGTSFMRSSPPRFARPVARRMRPLRLRMRSSAPDFYRWWARRLQRDRFQGLPLTLIVIAGSYLAVLGSGLAGRMAESDGMTDFDAAIFETLAPYRDPGLVAVFAWITELGDMATLTAVSVVATVFLWTRGPIRFVLPVWICILGAQITTWAGKFAIDRPRPDFLFDVTAHSPSFPSAHAAGAMAVYGIIAYAAARRLDEPDRRFELAYWTGVLIALVSFSRIFLNVHYASDVAGGLIVGAFWLLAGIAAAELGAARRARQTEA